MKNVSRQVAGRFLGLHRTTMRPFPRLESEPKSGALLVNSFFPQPLTEESNNEDTKEIFKRVQIGCR
jgi:hypothetical protein